MIPKTFTFLFVILIVNYASSKSVQLKSLTESHGQEIIEIKNPLKDLPELEEEPSAENFETFKVTTTTILPVTKKDTRRVGATVKELPKTVSPEDDDKRIEKELAELYRDNVDYKSDSSEGKGDSLQKLDATTTIKATVVTTKETTFADKPIARANDFKFQPNINNKAEVERFRTSVDDITCDKKYTTVKLRHEKQSIASGAAAFNASIIGILCTIFLNFLDFKKIGTV